MDYAKAGKEAPKLFPGMTPLVDTLQVAKSEFLKSQRNP